MYALINQFAGVNKKQDAKPLIEICVNPQQTPIV